MPSDGVVIVGTGQSGFQVAASLRMEGYDGPITLIGDEPNLPYQRPPLSKGFMAGKQDIEGTALRPLAFYDSHRIGLVMGAKVTQIDRVGRVVRLESGRVVPRTLHYDALVLAVGARNRTLPIKDAGLDGICYLRTDIEAVDIRQRLEHARDIVVIGGGFIGLELAAAACTLGKSVRVLELQSRLMPRVVSPILSDFYRDLHASQGVEISLGVALSEIVGYQGKVSQIVLSDGAVCPADLVLIGIGVVPNTELALDAGLSISNGIVVDEYLRTEDESVYAIGDCANHPNPYSTGRVRIESVQNAVDQAKCIAAAIVGRSENYRAVPWFWTDQFDIKLQMAGLSGGYGQVVTRGEPESRKFSLFYFRDGRLAAVDSVNRPGEHLAARKLIGAGTSITPEQAADLSVDLKMPAGKEE
ncbi:MAG: FAD-dependent oxidoreductase [Bryobacteraceae bacterium]|jgi:3-phenylpropionate/trans-cinnamate dioxygenase ferredoxin reductase subunit